MSDGASYLSPWPAAERGDSRSRPRRQAASTGLSGAFFFAFQGGAAARRRSVSFEMRDSSARRTRSSSSTRGTGLKYR